MTEIYRFLFDYITDKLTLPISRFLETIILFVIGEFAYLFAFKKVRYLYRVDIISGKNIGKILHWTIRIVCFVGIWAIVRIIIAYFKFFMLYGVLVFPLTCVFAIIVYAVDLLRKELNDHA